MSAVERLQAAIEKLDALKAESTPGRWLIDDAHPHDIWTDGVAVLGGTIHTVEDPYERGDYRPYGDAVLIVALHATIDAQLDLMRGALRYMQATGDEAHAVVIALADAILGDAS